MGSEQTACTHRAAHPGKALPYGYMASAEGGNLYTVVNASQEKAKVMLPEATGTGRVLFTDSGFMPVLEKNIVELGQIGRASCRERVCLYV